jgi:hypothetical protein
MDGDDIFSGPDSGELVAFFDDSCLFFKISETGPFIFS